jgi:hypothetical protein
VLDDISPWTEGLLEKADELSLSWVAHSAEAKALAASLAAEVADWERPQRANVRAATGLRKLTDAVSAIVGGMLISWGRTTRRAVARSLKKDQFTAAAIGFDTYRIAKDGLEALGYLHRKSGIRFSRYFTFSGKPEALMPSESLLRVAAERGVFPATARQHYRLVPSEGVPQVPADLLSMRTLWRRDGQQGNRRDRSEVDLSSLDTTGKRILRQVQEANEAAALHKVSGAMQPRWRRTFTSSTVDFQGDWQLNGRWTALGGADGCYQTLSEAQRLDLRIDGEPVCEIDVSSSILTILHGLHGLPLPEGDLYDIAPWLRKVVKRWVTAACGLGKPLIRWPDDTPDDIKTESVRAVGAAVMARYPFLRVPHEGILPARYQDHPEPSAVVAVFLMGREAAAITRAMELVWAAHAGELLLPVHDAILCRQAVALDVEKAMRRGYEEVCGVTPRLTRTPAYNEWDF